MSRRSLEIPDYRAKEYFRRLEEFLGSEGIDERLKRVESELRKESGVYLDYWVKPNVAWWLGLKEARAIAKRDGSSFRGALTPLMELPLQTAVKISALYSSMPEFKRAEYRSRILSDDILEPTLFEIDSAAHFWQLGYDIEWCESGSKEGKQTPEFIAQNVLEFEVECKVKKADAGRRIERRQFYRLLDEMIAELKEKGLSGLVSIVVPSQIPNSNSWRKEVAKEIGAGLTSGRGVVGLPKGARVEYDLVTTGTRRMGIKEVKELCEIEKYPYAHYAIVNTNDGSVVGFRLRSEAADAFLESVFKSLRRAKKQFTGQRAAIISCMLPGVESFEGLQKDSALQNMTYRFFENHATAFINAVSYVSEPVRQIEGNIIISDRPSLTFRNHKYDNALGGDIPVYG